MPLVPAKCPECGGNINIDSEKRAAVCEFCKQPFVVEEAITNFNTTYNITNHNSIKADVVMINESENKEQSAEDLKKKFKFFFEKIKSGDHDFDTTNAMYEISRKYCENYIKKNPDEIKFLLDYFYMIMEVYHFTFDYFDQYDFLRVDTLGKGMIGLLEYLQKEINFLSETEGKKARYEIDVFLDKVNSYIVSGVENYFEVLPSFREGNCREIWFDDTRVNRDNLIYGYINSDYAKEKHNEIEKIRKIAETEKAELFGIKTLNDADAIWGHYFTYRFNWDGVNDYIGEFKESFTSSEDVAAYVKEVTQGYVKYCKDERICFKCRQPLSMFGKCKNERCDMFKKKVYN